MQKQNINLAHDNPSFDFFPVCPKMIELDTLYLEMTPWGSVEVFSFRAAFPPQYEVEFLFSKFNNVFGSLEQIARKEMFSLTCWKTQI